MRAWAIFTESKSLSPDVLSRHSTTALPPPGGEVDRQALGAEGLADLVDQPLQVRRPGMSHLLMTIARGRLRSLASSMMRRVTTSIPLCALTTDRHRLDRRQGGDGVADQVGRAGRVDQVDPLAQMVQVKQRRVDRVLVLLLLLLEVAVARAVGNEPLRVTALDSNSRASAMLVLPHPP
jgi:hypothetical protein